MKGQKRTGISPFYLKNGISVNDVIPDTNIPDVNLYDICRILFNRAPSPVETHSLILIGSHFKGALLNNK